MKNIFLSFFILLFILNCTKKSFIKPVEKPPVKKDLVSGKILKALRVKVKETAEFYIGTPYKYGGRSSAGMDCSGLVYICYRKTGISIPRKAIDQYHTGKKVSNETLQPGDVLFFRTVKNIVSHSGIYIGNHKFIHASLSNGVMITSLSNPYFKKRYAGARRYIY